MILYSAGTSVRGFGSEKDLLPHISSKSLSAFPKALNVAKVKVLLKAVNSYASRNKKYPFKILISATKIDLKLSMS